LHNEKISRFLRFSLYLWYKGRKNKKSSKLGEKMDCNLLYKILTLVFIFIILAYIVYIGLFYAKCHTPPTKKDIEG